MAKSKPRRRPASARKPTQISSDSQPNVFYKPDEALQLIGAKISRRAFYSGLKRKEIPSIRVGRLILIPAKKFQVWMEGGFSGSNAA